MEKVNTNKTIYVGDLNMSLLEEIDYEVESSFKKKKYFRFIYKSR